ncbi:MAG TPA: DUF2520 domain-containing protein [Mycobacteriales bacterium]|jgi:predicted short-subunit dehydrogenase-like oxidoreductase (DUF2520 family)|nr:DUF2520 domain-containing protein [Mycobacteriales bacterium]
MTTPADRPARLAVGVISAGRVGATLGAALARAGHRVVAVAGVSDASRRRAADLLPGVAVRPPDEVAGVADLLVLAVPDDALAPLVGGLATADVVRRGTLVMHTSGAHGTRVLDPLTERGALPLALHPVMTFTGTEVDLQRLTGAAWGVTSEEVLRPVAETLVVEMGGEPSWVTEALRPLYHAGLAFGANHLVTLVAQSAELLAAAGVEEPQRMLGPLLGAALDNALRSGDRALTGPVARGDAGTVAKHLVTLATRAPESVDAYVAMARLTATRALAAGLLDVDAAATLLDALATRPDHD